MSIKTAAQSLVKQTCSSHPRQTLGQNAKQVKKESNSKRHYTLYRLAKYCPAYQPNPDEANGGMIYIESATTFFGTSACAGMTMNTFEAVSGGNDAFDATTSTDNCANSAGEVPTIAMVDDTGTVQTFELRIPYNDVQAREMGRVVLFFSQPISPAVLTISVSSLHSIELSPTEFF